MPGLRLPQNEIASTIRFGPNKPVKPLTPNAPITTPRLLSLTGILPVLLMPKLFVASLTSFGLLRRRIFSLDNRERGDGCGSHFRERAHLGVLIGRGAEPGIGREGIVA